MTVKKLGAEVILSSIFLPLIAWIAIEIITLKEGFAFIKTRSDIREETLKEIKDDVKFIKDKIQKL